MTAERCYREARAKLRAAGVSDAERTADELLRAFCGVSRTELLCEDRELSASETERFDAAVARRLAGEPLQ